MYEKSQYREDIFPTKEAVKKELEVRKNLSNSDGFKQEAYKAIKNKFNYSLKYSTSERALEAFYAGEYPADDLPRVVANIRGRKHRKVTQKEALLYLIEESYVPISNRGLKKDIVNFLSLDKGDC